MVEKITVSQVTKSYINNHDVLCDGVHCVYRESVSGMTGEEKNEYIVLNSLVDIRFNKLSELKKYIREQPKKFEVQIVSDVSISTLDCFDSRRDALRCLADVVAQDMGTDMFRDECIADGVFIDESDGTQYGVKEN